jgi:hypothetical protein
MSKTTQPARAPEGLGDFLWGVLAAMMVGGMLGTWIGISARGAELLGMPAWTYDFATFAGGGALALLWAAKRLGDQGDAAFATRTAAFAMVGGACVFFLTGFFGNDVGGSSRQGVDLDAMRQTLGHWIAWGTLVLVPGVAFLCNAGIVVSLARNRRSGR